MSQIPNMDRYGYNFTTPEGLNIFIGIPTSITKTEAISLAIEFLKSLEPSDLE